MRPRPILLASAALLALVATACGDDPRDGSGTAPVSSSSAAGSPTTSPDPTTQRAAGGLVLVAADRAAGAVHVWDADSFADVGTISGVHVAEHPGMVVIPGGLVVATDDESDELIVLDPARAAVAARAPLGGDPVHIAVDAQARYAAVSTSADEEAGTDGFTLVDLATMQAVDVPLETGEPGIAIGGKPLAVLHRNDEPGRVEVFPIDAVLDGDLKPAGAVDIDPFGHGEAVTADGMLAVATDEGIDVVDVTGEPTFARQIPWTAQGRSGGRGYYMRLAADGAHAVSYLRIIPEPQGDAETAAWQEWGNDLFVTDLATGAVRRSALGDGLVYRFSLGADRAAMVRMHPDGDVLHVIDVDPASATFATSVADIILPPITDAPVAGTEPWDAQGRRVALTPDGKTAFVSHGGDGLISVIDIDAGAVVRTIEASSDLDAGGDLVVVDPAAVLVDTIGR